MKNASASVSARKVTEDQGSDGRAKAIIERRRRAWVRSLNSSDQASFQKQSRQAPICTKAKRYCKCLVGTGRFELPACRLGGDRSIQLSYVPTIDYVLILSHFASDQAFRSSSEPENVLEP